jgi:hypothetical protein
MDLRLATAKASSFYLLHNVPTFNQCRMFSCVTVVCKHFAIYHDYPNYRWDFGRLRVNLWPQKRHRAVLWVLAQMVGDIQNAKRPNDDLDFMKRARWKLNQQPSSNRLVGNCLSILIQ